MNAGTNVEALDFDSVQRDNAEIQRRAQEVINHCNALGAMTPILAIHDVGAGGLSNAFPELTNDAGRGAHLDLRAVPLEETGMAPKEIWCNESQERYVLAVAPDSLPLVQAMAERERCPFGVVGTVSADRVLILEDGPGGERFIDIGCGFGGFMLIYLAAESKVVGLDMMGTSPSAARLDMFLKNFSLTSGFAPRSASGRSSLLISFISSCMPRSSTLIKSSNTNMSARMESANVWLFSAILAMIPPSLVLSIRVKIPAITSAPPPEKTSWPGELPPWQSGDAVDVDELVVIYHNWDELRRTMWDYVGIVRSTKRLQRARTRIGTLSDEVREYYWNFRVEPRLLELRNLIQVAELIIDCALQRRESRGLHFTLDYPAKLAEARHTSVRRPLGRA